MEKFQLIHVDLTLNTRPNFFYLDREYTAIKKVLEAEETEEDKDSEYRVVFWAKYRITKLPQFFPHEHK
jgi:hypothetical protein